MDSLSSMNNALSYIEEHLTEDINYIEISKIAYCSEYHFKRMFSFLSGISLSEYKGLLVFPLIFLMEEWKKEEN